MRIEVNLKIRVGIIGFGFSGKCFHAPFLKINSGFEVVAISSSRKSEVHDYFPTAAVYDSPHDLIKDKNVDLVINTGPNSVHFSLSAEALKAGKHVVIEKPFANTPEECIELIKIAKEQNLVLSVFQNRRWDGDFLTIQKLILGNELGKIMHFESHFDFRFPIVDPGSWRMQSGPGTGTWCDLGAHMVDQMLVLFGDPESVNADIISQRENSLTDDFFHVNFQYGNSRVVLQSSLYTNVTPRFQIFGTDGSFVKYKMDVQEPQLRQGLTPESPAFGYDQESDYGVLTKFDSASKVIKTERGDFNKYYDLLHAHIIDRSNENPVRAESALRVIELIELARLSSAERKTIKI